MSDNAVVQAYEQAKERFAELGSDVDHAMDTLDRVSLSIHCWQGDDVQGFESRSGALDGGIAVTGNYPGRARNIEELRRDLEFVYGLLPGRHRLNLHASYGDFEGKQVDRDAIEIDHYASWIEWCSQNSLGLDFNATLFSHPMAKDGFTLSHRNRAVREFFCEHVSRCRKIAAHMGRELKTACIHNLWIPDGSKDYSVERLRHREWLLESLDSIYGREEHSATLKDSLESKLFGIGSEAFVVGSHEFYLSYALKNDLMLCLDLGHFHPTESIADKLSALLPFFGELLLHVSRPMRWDSDHVVVQSDEVRELMQEIVRADALSRVHLALDFFDASINRVGAWTIGARATLKALLSALLEPVESIREMEKQGDGFSKLALLDESRNMPMGAIWDYYCLRNNVPAGRDWISEIKSYEKKVLSRRLS